MQIQEVKMRELVRAREQKNELQKEIFNMIQEQGFFSPWWGKGEDTWLDEDYGFDEEADRSIENEYHGKALFVQEASCAVPYLLKLLELEQLCKNPEETQEVKEAKKRLEKFKADQIEYASAIAKERFTWKHPGYAGEKVLSMIQLKSCWREEAD